MFNLLPKLNKETIRREYRVRLVIVVLWFLCVTSMIAAILLIPSFLLSSQKEKAAEERFNTLSKSAEQRNAEELNSLLLGAKSSLSMLSHKAPDVFLHELLMKIVEVKNGRVSLNSISFSFTGKGLITITGVARDRNSLLSYSKALEQSGVFEKVEVPISNFAKDNNIDFSIRASGVFNKSI